MHLQYFVELLIIFDFVGRPSRHTAVGWVGVPTRRSTPAPRQELLCVVWTVTKRTCCRMLPRSQSLPLDGLSSDLDPTIRVLCCVMLKRAFTLKSHWKKSDHDGNGGWINLSVLYYTTVQSVSYSSQRTRSRLSNKTVLSIVHGLCLETLKKI